MPFRRRTAATDDPIRRAFGTAASLVDHAQRSLLAAIPTSRDPGVPLEEAIRSFLGILDEADAAMPAWKDERFAHEWTNCSEGIAGARSAAERLLEHKVGLTFEQLNAQIGDVLYPLEAFVDAERGLRRR